MNDPAKFTAREATWFRVAIVIAAVGGLVIVGSIAWLVVAPSPTAAAVNALGVVLVVAGVFIGEIWLPSRVNRRTDRAAQ